MQKNDFVAKVPYGTRDFLVGEAQKKRELESKLADKFALWGYQEVVTPTFEYWDIFESGILNEQAFKFFDRSGNALTLRPDMTSPIARLASTRMRENTSPKRLSYIANVFRYEQAQAGRQCEFYQAGVELLGSSSPAADAEIIALAVETLRVSGLEHFKISLGHVDYLNGVIESTNLEEKQKNKIRELLSRRDLAGLEHYAKEVGLDAALCQNIQEILFLHGGQEIFAKAHTIANNCSSGAALQNLTEIYAILQNYKVAEKVDFDLGLIRNFAYYTGMVFEGYTPGLGFPICGGGRYDKMMASLGSESPAVGFSAGIDRILLALAKKENFTAPSDCVYVSYAQGYFANALNLAQQMRSETKKVELAPTFQSREAAEQSAGKKTLLYIDK